ncbi:MAG: isoprenylcysteine carboxylmethyltransferase family protein [Pseudomonadota bacterium]
MTKNRYLATDDRRLFSYRGFWSTFVIGVNSTRLAEAQGEGTSVLLLKGLIGSLFQVGFVGATLLVPAMVLRDGDWYWPRALALLAAWLLLVQIALVVMYLKSPESLAVRLQSPVGKRERQPLADTIVTSFLILYLVGWMIFIPVDVFYLEIFPTPSWSVALIGGALFVIGYCMSVVVLIQNQFAAPTVEHQTDHKVIDSGFYALVRHPFYTALILMFSGMALWLESWAALIGIAGLVIVLIARIRVEEAEL